MVRCRCHNCSLILHYKGPHYSWYNCTYKECLWFIHRWKTCYIISLTMWNDNERKMSLWHIIKKEHFIIQCGLLSICMHLNRSKMWLFLIDHTINLALISYFINDCFKCSHIDGWTREPTKHHAISKWLQYMLGTNDLIPQ